MPTDIKKILIVEDDADNRELLKEVIDYCLPSYSYACVNNGEEALKVAENSNFDLVFSDINLPKKNGMEIVSTLRKSKKYQDTPIVALTANAMKGMKEEAMEYGFSEYLTKPCQPKDLISVIKKYLQDKSKAILS